VNIRPEEHIRKTPIFHITSILNLDSILKCSKLLALNYLREIDFKSIANNDVQGRRSQISINHPPYGTLHDYVPFYFAPRSPMLYANKETKLAVSTNSMISIILNGKFSLKSRSVEAFQNIGKMKIITKSLSG
jgi:hypothetical protein